jgi:hypothetical protein
MLTFIEFCAGLGGARFAMEKAGHKCLGYSELETGNRDCYKMIHKTEGLWFYHDVVTVDPRDIPEADCYCITCPQYLVLEMMDIISARMPEKIIVEGSKGGNLIFWKKFLDLGYYVEHEEIPNRWEWAITIAQLSTRKNILPIGAQDYVRGDSWEEKEFPAEAYEKIKDMDYITKDNNALIRLTQIPILTVIAKKLDF